MKTFLVIVLILVIIVLSLAAAGVIQLRRAGPELVREADRFNVPVIDKAIFQLSNWDYQSLKPFLSEKFVTSLPKGEFQKELDELSILGKVESIRIHRHVNHARYAHWLYGQCAVNKYSVSTNFSKGRGVVIFNLNHCYKKAEITSFQVHSKVLPAKSPALQ